MDVSPYLVEFCRLFIFTVLLFSSLGKGRTFAKFRDDLTESMQVSQGLAAAATATLIVVEGVLAIFLLLNNRLTFYAMVGAVMLFAGFTVWITYSVIQDRLVRCNCFGQNEEYVSYLDIIRNGVLLLASGFYLWGPQASSISLSVQFVFFGMALTAYMVITNLKNISIVARASKHS
ncbi:MAG TPA: hypothetical protein DCE41_29500 [Cytophagales bacterium]|nr:hypothetical protein [Cytophagales bacterium]HAA18560.1 hypothetical protein [Cytophagales bacterium]HAP60212.1 hypothetical protein [Cytophagales bacterium]